MQSPPSCMSDCPLILPGTLAVIAIYLFALVPVLLQSPGTEEDTGSVPISLVIASVVSVLIFVTVSHVGHVLMDLIAPG